MALLGIRNICDYVESELDTFVERPLGAVDSLVLSWFSNFRLEALGEQVTGSVPGVPLRETLRAECFRGLFDLWDPESCKRLLQAMAASPRFRDIRVSNFVMEREGGDTPSPKQFSAVTLLLDDGATYVAYRGTDATFAGWREDFDMTFARPVPSQVAALDYLVGRVAPATAGPIVLGGHSKGGNLAVYAAAEAPAEVQRRVTRVFSHDGPGFDAEFLASEGFRRIAGRIDKTLPQSSIVGMMLENQEDYSVVRSTSVGIFQHNPFSWVVEGQGFVEVEGISAGARHTDAALNAWISGRTPEERRRFTDELYDLLTFDGAKTFAELRDDWQRTLPELTLRIARMDPETRRFMLETVSALVRGLLPVGAAAQDGLATPVTGSLPGEAATGEPVSSDSPGDEA